MRKGARSTKPLATLRLADLKMAIATRYAGERPSRFRKPGPAMQEQIRDASAQYDALLQASPHAADEVVEFLSEMRVEYDLDRKRESLLRVEFPDGFLVYLTIRMARKRKPPKKRGRPTRKR